MCLFLSYVDWYNFTGNVDYDTGPYNVMFMKGNTTATLCINITNDEILEEDETFGLIIDAVSSLACIIRGSPSTVNVTILRTECMYVHKYMFK